MLSFLLAYGYAWIVVVPFIILLWISSAVLCYLFYHLIKGNF